MKKLLGLLILLIVPLGFAQKVVISPQSIVVNPLPAFDVEVWVDKDRSGEARPTYDIGETIRIGVHVSEDSYIYLFNVRSNGEVTQILPNRLSGGGNFIPAGGTRYFPPEGARFTFEIDGPTGLDKVIAVASKTELDTSTLASFASEGSFASSNIGEESFAQTLSIVVKPLPQDTWVTDTALFYVTRRGGSAPELRYGALNIHSNPSGAAVYVDGQFVGYAPVRYGTRAGEHLVRLELAGYSNFQTQVSLAGGQTLRLDATLAAQQSYGSLLLHANVGGAEVFIDGRFVGIIASGSGELRLDNLAPGRHHFRLVAPGFQTLEQDISISAGATTRLTVSQARVSNPPPVSDPLINIFGLNPYPRSSLLGLEQDDGRVRLEFSVRASLEEVYAYFHDGLASQGWHRVALELKGPATKAEADYRRNGRELELRLDKKGNSGKFRLELELEDDGDDDNDDDDNEEDDGEEDDDD